MAQPNVNIRTREIGWAFGNTNGSLTNTSGSGQAHGVAPALAAGVAAFTFAIQTIDGLLGGAAVFSRGFVLPSTVEPTRIIDQVKSTHAVYIGVSAHLRSAGNVDLPGTIRLITNDLWPTEAAVPVPSRIDLGDWVTNAWQEWEKFSPLTVPTPPPGFTGGGAAGVRYEYRKALGRMPSNFLWVSLTNNGTVSATEWGIGIWAWTQPDILD